MNKIFFIISIIISLNAFSQTENELDQISDFTCECLTKKKIKKSELEKLELELGLCMMESVSKAKVDLDFTDEDVMTTLGEKVGVRMAVSCPPFMELIGLMMEDDPNFLDDEEEVRKISFQGELSKLNKDQFVTIELKSEDGKKHTFYWFEYFEGANILKDNTNFLMNKKINIEYKEVEYYFPKYDDYVKIKVITKLLEK